MKKNLVSYIFASLFFICAVLITDIHAKISKKDKRQISSVALASRNNEVIFFKRHNQSQMVTIKLCASGENIQKNKDCNVAKNSSEIKVSTETLKKHLMTAFAMTPLPKQSLSDQMQQYWQMKSLGNPQYTLDLEARELEKIENILAEVCGENKIESKCAKENVDIQKLIQLRKKFVEQKGNATVIDSINQTMSQIIEKLILSPDVHFISQNSPGFIYSILNSYIHPNQGRFEFAKIAASTVEMKDLRYQGKNKVRTTKIKITDEFEISTTEVTQFQWFALMGFNPSYFKRSDDCPEVFIEGIGTPLKSSLCSDFPVENVSWKQIQVFLEKLNQQDTTHNYRLPSEAEWVLASSDEKREPYFFGSRTASLVDYAWYSENAGGKPHSVARKKPNLAGLFDVYGNVAEWVQDSFDELPDTAPENYTAKENDTNQFLKVVRGGHYSLDGTMTNSILRFSNFSFEPMKEVGFRLVRTKK
jgi:formylglycine-generating enzyme required for sulfatase activity